MTSRVLTSDPQARPARATAPMQPGRVAAREGARNSASSLFAQPLAPILTAVGVAGLIVISILFARSSGLVSALWGAGGLAVAVWLRSGRGVAYDLCFGGLMTAGVLAAEFLVGNPPALSLMFTAANMIEIVAAVVLVRRFAPDANLSTVEGAARFLLSAAVVAPLPAAAFAALMLQAMTGADPMPAFQTWWFGHALGMAVVAGFGLALTPSRLAAFASPWRMVEAAGLFTLLGALCVMTFSTLNLPITFTLLPFLLLIAARLRVLGATAALMVVAIMAVGGSMMGNGPYALRFEPAQAAMMAQLLVLFGYLPIMLVAVLLDERDALAERARAGQRRAELASEAKSRLLANVAHEIKSPVGGIIGIGQLWTSGQLGPVSPTQAEMAEMLVKTARQVESLSHDLLDVARAESGAVRVELRPTDVRGLLEDVRRALVLRPEAAGIEIEIEAEGEALVALADSQRLNQIVANLGSNAVKYGGSGGKVRFQARRVGGVVRIEVIDQGPGLSPEKQAQLFEPFNRLGLERSSVEGHGIGLALAKRLTELQGGTIGVRSTVGEGSAFWVEIPAA